MLPTLTQLPTGEDDDEHTNNIRYNGGCQLSYTEFEQNSLCQDLSQRARKFFGEFPIFIRESRKILENSENFGIKSILIAYHKLRHKRFGHIFMYPKRDQLVAERRCSIVRLTSN